LSTLIGYPPDHVPVAMSMKSGWLSPVTAARTIDEVLLPFAEVGSSERRPTTYLVPPTAHRHRYTLTTRTRIAGAVCLALCGVMFAFGENLVFRGFNLPVRFFAVAVALYRGLPFLLMPRTFEGSAERLLGADAPTAATPRAVARPRNAGKR